MTGALVLFWLAPSLVEAITRSGQLVGIADTPSQRVAPAAQIAPGAPPVLSFRLFEGKMRHRFNDLDLVLDDAGH
jgi:hypothetical protein